MLINKEKYGKNGYYTICPHCKAEISLSLHECEKPDFIHEINECAWCKNDRDNEVDTTNKMQISRFIDCYVCAKLFFIIKKNDKIISPQWPDVKPANLMTG